MASATIRAGRDLAAVLLRGALRPVRDAEVELAVEQRPLADYDTALGIDLDASSEGGFAS